ncbi:MAG: META domain-containing protein [Alistipes sp.]
MKKWMFLAAMVTLLLSACSKKATPIEAINGEWDVTEINGAPVAEGVTPWLGFDTTEQRIYGNLGVNSVIGMMEPNQTPGTIDMSKLASTLMMGAPDQMAVEDTLSKVLAQVKGFELTKEGVLELHDADNKVIVSLVKR